MLANKVTIPSDCDINHIDKNPSNNRPWNLELILSSEHVRHDCLAQKKSNNTSGIMGICWNKSNKGFQAASSVGFEMSTRITSTPCIVLCYQLLRAHLVQHGFEAPAFTPTQYALERSRQAKTWSKAYKQVQQLISEGIIDHMPLTGEVA